MAVTPWTRPQAHARGYNLAPPFRYRSIHSCDQGTKSPFSRCPRAWFIRFSGRKDPHVILTGLEDSDGSVFEKVSLFSGLYKCGIEAVPNTL